MPQKTWLVQEEVILCTNGGKTFNRYGKIYGGTGTMRPSGKSKKMRFLTEDGIDNDDYNEVKSDLEAKIADCEKELKDCSQDLSNLAEYTDVALKIASTLGSTWDKMDFKVCQKIQNLAFPKGIKWDGEKRCYRTDGMNEFFRQIGLLRGSVRGEGIKETDTDCSVSVLVAGEGLEPPASGL